MYIVKVLQSGIELNSIKLESGHTYYVGRGSDCDVVLNNEAGISRKHVKISDETGQWQIELIARYGNIVFDNQNYTSLPIQGEREVPSDAWADPVHREPDARGLGKQGSGRGVPDRGAVSRLLRPRDPGPSEGDRAVPGIRPRQRRL